MADPARVILLGTYTPPKNAMEEIEDARFIASLHNHTVEVTTDIFLVRLRKSVLANNFRPTLLMDTTLSALASVVMGVLEKGFSRKCPPEEIDAYIGVFIHKMRVHQARLALKARKS